MSGQTSKVLEHLRTLAGNVVDTRATEPARAGHARMIAEHAQDLRESVEVVAGVLSGSEVWDVALQGKRVGASADVVRAAAERIRMRRELAQLRANEVPIGKPVVVVDPGTGRQEAFPLVRQLAIEVGEPGPTIPIVPGITAGAAVVNPTLPLDDDTQVVIANVGDDARWDFAAGYVDVSRQALDFLDPVGAALLDETMFDAVDLAIESDVIAAIEAAAGDTRVAATLADDLDGAEGVAGVGGLGPAWLLLANPVDWPAVRRALPAAWGDGPRPLPIVSSGATAGTVTYVGRHGFALLTTARQTHRADVPKLVGQDVAVARQFKLVIRNADAIATVTGVGA